MAVLFIVTVAYILTAADLGFTTLELTDITTSEFVSSNVLLLIRFIFALVINGSLFHIVTDKNALEITVSLSTGGLKTVKLLGFDRLSTFTLWCWTLQGVYFTLACCCSLSLSPSSLSSSFPETLLLNVTWVLFEISLALAYLVTFLVTFVLIPAAEAKEIPHKFFTPMPVLCHNANAVFMAVDLLLNRLPMPFPHIAFIQLFGLAYVLFAWRLHAKRGIFFYFFLDYDRPYGVCWYLGLFVAVRTRVAVLFSLLRRMPV